MKGIKENGKFEFVGLLYNPLGTKSALVHSPIGSIVRPEELHSPSAEENCLSDNVASLRSFKVATPLAPLKRLSPVDLQPANGFDKPFAAVKFEEKA